MQKQTQPSTSASSLFVGMDVHKRSIALCVYDKSVEEVVDERQLPNNMPKIRKYIRQLQRRYGAVRCCYEALSCGFGLQRAMQAQGVPCEVIAPSSIPRRPVERVKTDRRDALKLATLYAAGLLRPVCVPEEEEEAVRSLLRRPGGYRHANQTADPGLYSDAGLSVQGCNTLDESLPHVA